MACRDSLYRIYCSYVDLLWVLSFFYPDITARTRKLWDQKTRINITIVCKTPAYPGMLPNLTHWAFNVILPFFFPTAVACEKPKNRQGWQGGRKKKHTQKLHCETTSEASKYYLQSVSRLALERHHIIHLKALPHLDAIHWNHRLWTAGQRHSWKKKGKKWKIKRKVLALAQKNKNGKRI